MTHENKFGLFIHWGLYSIDGVHEQDFARRHIDRATYEGLIKKFNPVDYNPEEWVLLAKKNGMKYICFTTKHHDGFCMWDTKYTDFNVMNTLYGKDVLKMLADACHKHGLGLSLYYSNPDWHHEFGYNPNSTHQWRSQLVEMPNIEIYKEYIKNQITELLTNYGEIYTLFWDIPPRVNDPSINALARKLQPNIKINDRGFDEGDFSTPEREYQSTDGKRFNRMTEACNSLGEQAWGYRKNEDFYTKRYLTCSIDKIMAMGGSYLLNVGPDGRGVITNEYKTRLNDIGDWYNRMNGCLENHKLDEFEYNIPLNTYIATTKNGKTYLHFYNGLCSSAITLKQYPKIPKCIKLLNTGKELTFSITAMPEYIVVKKGVSLPDVMHISDIPTEKLLDEPIVIEITW